METPQDESNSEQEAAEQLKRAFALLERHPEFPSVEVQIHDNDQETKRSITAEEKERLTEPRLAHLIKFLDNRGAAYLRLVTDLESVKALTVIMAHFARATWLCLPQTPSVFEVREELRVLWQRQEYPRQCSGCNFRKLTVKVSVKRPATRSGPPRLKRLRCR
jgi:hypothetical protein